MTLDRDAARQRCERATEGEWEWSDDYPEVAQLTSLSAQQGWEAIVLHFPTDPVRPVECLVPDRDDAAFIARARPAR